MARKQRMSMREAMDLVPDDMPDGAFFAMAHEMAGLESGDGFDELLDTRPAAPVFTVNKGMRKRIEKFGALHNHDAYHWTVRDADGKVVADWWPHKRKWRVGQTSGAGNWQGFVAALSRAPGEAQ